MTPNPVHSRIYEKNATSSRILGDIRNYFNGARQSDLMAFHTSDNDYAYSCKRLDNNVQGEYNASNEYDSYYQSNDFMREVHPDDQSAFSRSLSFSTNGMREGETRLLTIVKSKLYIPSNRIYAGISYWRGICKRFNRMGRT